MPEPAPYTASGLVPMVPVADIERSGLQPGPIHYPDYLPKGEYAIQDPDGHRLMLAQSGTDTP